MYGGVALLQDVFEEQFAQIPDEHPPAADESEDTVEGATTQTESESESAASESESESDSESDEAGRADRLKELQHQVRKKMHSP